MASYVQVNCVCGLDWCRPIQTAPATPRLAMNWRSSPPESSVARCPYNVWGPAPTYFRWTEVKWDLLTSSIKIGM